MDLDCKLVYDQEKVIFDFFQIFSGCKDESYGAGGRVGDSDTRKAKCTLRSELKGATPTVTSFVIVGKYMYPYSNVRNSSPVSRSVSHISSQITHKRFKKSEKHDALVSHRLSCI